MDGVWRPAGGENPRARGFPGSRHPAKVRGQGGKALCPLAAPGKRPVGKSPEPAQGGTAKSEPNQTGTKFRHWRRGRNRPISPFVTARLSVDVHHACDYAALIAPTRAPPRVLAGPRVRETVLISLSHQRQLDVISPL